MSGKHNRDQAWPLSESERASDPWSSFETEPVNADLVHFIIESHLTALPIQPRPARRKVILFGAATALLLVCCAIWGATNSNPITSEPIAAAVAVQDTGLVIAAPPPPVAPSEPDTRVADRAVPRLKQPVQTSPTTRETPIPLPGPSPPPAPVPSTVRALSPLDARQLSANLVAAPSTSAPPVVGPETSRANEVDAVLGTIGAYATALTEMNVKGAVQAWPSVDQRSLAAAFNTLSTNSVGFDACAVELSASTGVVMCHATAQFVPKVGRQAVRRSSQQWRFTMSKNQDVWTIENGTALNDH